MGLDCSTIKFLAGAKAAGVDFQRTLTIGRQDLFPKRHTMRRVFDALEINEDAKAFLRANPYGEALFEKLGADHIDSMDSNSYEDATVIHDMNEPIPESLKKQYSLVYDGGSLEHIFNAPQALKNCMEMVQVGGYFIQASIANNFMGHGFWQFSPEVFFRAMSEENGFRTEFVLLNEVTTPRWVAVQHPEIAQSRVELCNSNQTYIFAIAKRIADKPIFERVPQQGFYVSMWDNGVADHASGVKPRPSFAQKWKISIRKRAVKLGRKIVRRPYNKPYFERVAENDLLAGRIPELNAAIKAPTNEGTVAPRAAA